MIRVIAATSSPDGFTVTVDGLLAAPVLAVAVVAG
jgi:hypothetical protein